MDLSNYPRPPLLILFGGRPHIDPAGADDIEQSTLFVRCSKYKAAKRIRTGTKHHCCYV